MAGGVQANLCLFECVQAVTVVRCAVLSPAGPSDGGCRDAVMPNAIGRHHHRPLMLCACAQVGCSRSPIPYTWPSLALCLIALV